LREAIYDQFFMPIGGSLLAETEEISSETEHRSNGIETIQSFSGNSTGIDFAQQMARTQFYEATAIKEDEQSIMGIGRNRSEKRKWMTIVGNAED